MISARDNSNALLVDRLCAKERLRTLTATAHVIDDEEIEVGVCRRGRGGLDGGLGAAMGVTQYVQHISGQGEKWEVSASDQLGKCNEWEVLDKQHAQLCHYLPKSEYRLCPAPEVWVDVTETCEIGDYSNNIGAFWSILHCNKDNATSRRNVMSRDGGDYRLKKTAGGFRVEMKVRT
jgi:hypothetical protein